LWEQSVPYPGSERFFRQYTDKYHTWPDYHGAEAYAAFQVVADVAGRAKSFDPDGLREALMKTNMISIMGPVKFVSYGKKSQQNRLPTYLLQWKEDELKIVWPPRLAGWKFIFPFPGWK
jgi:branched-chain amino acid transport system substrate-binding protein